MVPSKLPAPASSNLGTPEAQAENVHQEPAANAIGPDAPPDLLALRAEAFSVVSPRILRDPASIVMEYLPTPGPKSSMHQFHCNRIEAMGSLPYEIEKWNASSPKPPARLHFEWGGGMRKADLAIRSMQCESEDDEVRFWVEVDASAAQAIGEAPAQLKKDQITVTWEYMLPDVPWVLFSEVVAA